MTPGGPLPEPILVPLDGSSNAERALRPAKVLADALGCPLRVVHVLAGEAAADPEEKARATGVFTTYVRRLAARRHLDENTIQVAVLSGAPADG
jgi:nucleotide-binding universal stress UspA family protein